jgi:hypothetical protein
MVWLRLPQFTGLGTRKADYSNRSVIASSHNFPVRNDCKLARIRWPNLTQDAPFTMRYPPIALDNCTAFPCTYRVVGVIGGLQLADY